MGAGEGLLVGSGVGRSVGMSVGAGEGLLVGMGVGQMPSSVDEQVEAEALQLEAPQHAKGVGAVQATHDEVPLRSAGPEQPTQSRVPVPAYEEPPGQRL